MPFLRHLAFSLLTALVLTSCVPLATPSEPPFATRQEQWDCVEVIDTRLESFPFDADAETARAWIQSEYMLDAADIRFDLSADGAQSMLHWNQSAKPTYSALLWNDIRESASVSVIWYEQAPTLADALGCLGDPPLYRAYLAPTPGGSWTLLELWYPERGLLVGAHVTRKVAGMTIDQPVSGITYVQPGPPEDLIPRFFWTTTRDSERYVERLKGLKPWPGDISQITIDERG